MKVSRPVRMPVYRAGFRARDCGLYAPEPPAIPIAPLHRALRVFPKDHCDPFARSAAKVSRAPQVPLAAHGLPLSDALQLSG
jgi:hypothetical protein